MERDILEEVQRLRAERQPFALATVVAARQPASGTPGARAIVLADGRMEGWVGGSCAQPTVVRQGLEAIADGASRLVVLRPDAGPEAATTLGVVHVPMLCASQGELQIFVEPFLPQIELVIIGASPAAQALARLGSVLEFDVWACDPDAGMETFPDASRLVPDLAALAPQLTAHTYVVVATMNAYDEDALEVVLNSDASYVGVVASQRRLVTLQESLRQRGVSEERIQRLKRPKGLIGTALRPGEIAFSAMADLLDARRQRVGFDLAPATALTPPRAEAIDPICGMTVDIATAHFTSERDGQTYYFCCAGCKRTFESS
ncbi:MAG: XdhC family protein [Candidatus Limnocylindrales bacterium]